ncbi:hypothetical protein N8714_03410 [Rhodobacteraceae bacterium]|nr:hypothetical protein [Paracoccaceae bacterium]
MAKKAIRIGISTKAVRYKANLEAMACEASFTWMKMVSAIFGKFTEDKTFLLLCITNA